jgi:hypothetical protein
VTNPFVAGGQGIQAPMDEHAEAVVSEPGGVAGSWFGLYHFLILKIKTNRFYTISFTSS